MKGTTPTDKPRFRVSGLPANNGWFAVLGSFGLATLCNKRFEPGLPFGIYHEDYCLGHASGPQFDTEDLLNRFNRMRPDEVASQLEMEKNTAIQMQIRRLTGGEA